MPDPIFVQHADLDPDEFRNCCARTTVIEEYPLASGLQHNVVMYTGERFRDGARNSRACLTLKTELHRCLKDGPGVLVVRNAFADTEVIDVATGIFNDIILKEKELAQHRGDHFTNPGENDRVWNALQKFCEHDATAFLDYYANPVLGIMSESWLGPCFQMTSQVNIVKPGGQAQKPHRDYHLGFQNDSVVCEYPLSVQVASQYLTLQGAVAHSEMSVDSGPTKVLPFSHQYCPGYLAWRNLEFQKYFEEHSVQISLMKGDALFFSPAVFHAAGANTTRVDRVANLLQVSVAFGKTMETIDWPGITKLVYPVLLKRYETAEPNLDFMRWLGGSIAEGYSFPTNLDSDPPIEGSAPVSIQQLMTRCLRDRTPVRDFNAAVDASVRRRMA